MRAGAAACAAGAQGMAVGGTPFCKKWVRTRRAILLRMSNRSVQVSFYDGAHLGLSGDGHSARYVDAAGRRLAVATQAALAAGAAAGPAAAAATSELADVVRRIAYANRNAWQAYLQQIVTAAKASSSKPE